ncbi:MAG: IS3 family transposase [Betaproteobacteria bacterium]|nr:IS3 family transposase [Betaproteobacteria bacterium]
MIGLACQYGRYGYRRIALMVNRSGLRVSRDRVERIWRRGGAAGAAQAAAPGAAVAERR